MREEQNRPHSISPPQALAPRRCWQVLRPGQPRPGGPDEHMGVRPGQRGRMPSGTQRLSPGRCPPWWGEKGAAGPESCTGWEGVLQPPRLATVQAKHAPLTRVHTGTCAHTHRTCPHGHVGATQLPLPLPRDTSNPGEQGQPEPYVWAWLGGSPRPPSQPGFLSVAGDRLLPSTLQAKPVGFTVHAVVTTSDLEMKPSELDFGHCTIYEAVRTEVDLCNHSLLPQEFGFVGLPKVSPWSGTGGTGAKAMG